MVIDAANLGCDGALDLPERDRRAGPRSARARSMRCALSSRSATNQLSIPAQLPNADL